MNDILLIQPDGSRPRLTHALHEAGIVFTAHSFIRIRDAATDIPDLSAIDAVIWVSKNAVEFAHQHNIQIPRRTRMYAVGPGTAKLASQTFHAPCQCPTKLHSSEGLLNFAELQNLSEQQWCVVKGRGGRELMADTLIARGANVLALALYERLKKPLKDPSIVQDWKQRINKIVVSSAEQLSYFLSELPNDAQDWLTQCHWVVPSERLAALIPFAGKDAITITQSASETAMIDALINDGSDYDRRQ